MQPAALLAAVRCRTALLRGTISGKQVLSTSLESVEKGNPLSY